MDEITLDTWVKCSDGMEDIYMVNIKKHPTMRFINITDDWGDTACIPFEMLGEFMKVLQDVTREVFRNE